MALRQPLSSPQPLSTKVISPTHVIHFCAFHHFKAHDPCSMPCIRTSHTVNTVFYHVIQSALESKAWTNFWRQFFYPITKSVQMESADFEKPPRNHWFQHKLHTMKLKNEPSTRVGEPCRWRGNARLSEIIGKTCTFVEIGIPRE